MVRIYNREKLLVQVTVCVIMEQNNCSVNEEIKSLTVTSSGMYQLSVHSTNYYYDHKIIPDSNDDREPRGMSSKVWGVLVSGRKHRS